MFNYLYILYMLMQIVENIENPLVMAVAWTVLECLILFCQGKKKKKLESANLIFRF